MPVSHRPRRHLNVNVNVNLYSASSPKAPLMRSIVVPHTQGAQVSHVLPANYTVPCLYLVSIHRMAHPRLRLRISNCSLLLIYLPRKDERLSRPGWLTYSGPTPNLNLTLFVSHPFLNSTCILVQAVDPCTKFHICVSNYCANEILLTQRNKQTL